MTFWIVAVFLVFFLLHYLLDTGLTMLNLRHAVAAGDAVPEALKGRITKETARKSLEYTIVKGRFGFVRGSFGAGLTLTVLFSGLLPWLDARLAGLGLEGAHLFVAFLIVLSILLGVVNEPFRLYGTFHIESRFGFNRMTWKLWLQDRLKGLMLGAALGPPFIYTVYAFMEYTGVWWWLWLFGFITAFQVVMVWLYPSFIAPLFNRFTPMPEGEMKARVEALARQVGFRMRGLFLMDASRRSGHSNAYFSGFFRPRIVLFDTLLEKLSIEEALAVLAHEMGHFRARHIHKSVALQMAGTCAMLYVLSWLIGWTPLFHAFGFETVSHHAALTLLMLGGGAFTFFLTPLLAWYSRRNEYEADAFSVRALRTPEALKSALARLNDENLANLHPHPWFSRVHYSHPTLLERMAAVDALGKGSMDGGSAAGTPAKN